MAASNGRRLSPTRQDHLCLQIESDNITITYPPGRTTITDQEYYSRSFDTREDP